MSYNSVIFENIFKPMMQSMMKVFHSDLTSSEWMNDPSEETLSKIFFNSLSRFAQSAATTEFTATTSSTTPSTTPSTQATSLVKKVVRKVDNKEQVSYKRAADSPVETDEPSSSFRATSQPTCLNYSKKDMQTCMWDEGKKLCDSKVQKVRQLPNNKVYCSRHYKIMCGRLGVTADIGASNNSKPKEEAEHSHEHSQPEEELSQPSQPEQQPQQDQEIEQEQESTFEDDITSQVVHTQVVRKIKRVKVTSQPEVDTEEVPAVVQEANKYEFDFKNSAPVVYDTFKTNEFWVFKLLDVPDRPVHLPKLFLHEKTKIVVKMSSVLNCPDFVGMWIDNKLVEAKNLDVSVISWVRLCKLYVAYSIKQHFNLDVPVKPAFVHTEADDEDDDEDEE